MIERDQLEQSVVEDEMADAGDHGCSPCSPARSDERSPRSSPGTRKASTELDMG